MRLTFARYNRPFSSADGKFVERKLSENTANKLHFVSREDTLYQIKGEENYELIHTLRGKLMRDRGMSVEQAMRCAQGLALIVVSITGFRGNGPDN